MKQRFIVNSKRVKKNTLDAVMACTSEKIKAVTIEDYVPDKTAEQRSFWHLLLQRFGDEVGYTLPEMKAIVKKHLLGSKTVSVAGVTTEIIESSEKQDRKNYSELIDATYQLAAEVGVMLPPPRYNDA